MYDDTKNYEAIRKIANELRTTDTPQIITQLARFDKNDKCVGKCALGVLSCKFYKTLTQDDIHNVSYSDIIHSTGISKDFSHNIPLLELYGVTSNINFGVDYYLEDAIFALNDNGFTFKQIADFLETTFIPEHI